MTATTIDAGDGLPLTLPALLRQRVKTRGEHDLAAFDSERISYAEAEARSRRVAKGLLAAGVCKGAHVAILQPPSPDFIAAVLGITRIGAVAVPLSTMSTPEELRGLLRNADANFLLAAPGFRSHQYDEALRSAFPELDYARPPPLRSTAAPWLRRIWFTGPAMEGRDAGWSIEAMEAAGDAIDDAYLEAIEDRVSPADRFFIVHTSGSTAAPKGVMHQHGAVIRTLDNINEIRGYGQDDALYSPTPWFWVAGLSYCFFATFVAGGRIIMPNATAPADILDVIERERPTATLGYWQTVSRLAADPSFAGRDLSSIRKGNLYPIMAEDTRPVDFSLRHGIYGLSEAAGALTLSPNEGDIPESLRGSFGPVLPGFEAKIVDLETGAECPLGELGEIWIRGPFMMEGYYGRPRSQVFQSDGWYRTSDVGNFDAENNLYLKGRIGEMIKTSGANVSPKEVEPILTNLVGGSASMVIGVPSPDYGQVVAAVVVTDKDIDEAELRRELAGRLSTYKVPRRIMRMSEAEVPLLASGKVDLRTLATMVQDRW